MSWPAYFEGTKFKIRLFLSFIQPPNRMMHFFLLGKDCSLPKSYFLVRDAHLFSGIPSGRVTIDFHVRQMPGYNSQISALKRKAEMCKIRLRLNTIEASPQIPLDPTSLNLKR